jgi:hypothetical protein
MTIQKTKYTLTDDIIEIKKEPIQYSDNKSDQRKIIKSIATKDRLSLNIDKTLKTNLHMHCVRNKKAMTDVIEDLIIKFLRDNKEI